MVLPGAPIDAPVLVAPAPEPSAQEFSCGGGSSVGDGPVSFTGSSVGDPVLFSDGYVEEEGTSNVGIGLIDPTDAPSDVEGMPTVPTPSGVEVPVTCTSCGCEGTTDDGDIVVFDNPSSGQRVSSRTVTNV